MSSGAAAVLAVLTAVTTYVFLRAAKSKPETSPDGSLVLRYPWSLTALGVVGTATAIALGVASHVASVRHDESPLALDLGSLCLLAIAAFVSLEFSRRRIEISDRGILSRSPWGGTRFAPWHAIESIDYSQRRICFVVRGAGFKPIRAVLFLSGIRALVEETRRHCPESVLDGAVTGVAIVERGHADRAQS